MKTIKLISLLLVIATSAFAQNFKKGALAVHANFGIEVYDTKYSYHVKYNNLDTTVLTTDKAANKNKAFGVEYAVINKLTVGIRAKFNNYYVSEDSITKTTATAKSQDYFLTVNYHLVDKRVFDLSAGLGLGGSHLYYNDNIKSNAHPDGNIVNGKGPYLQFQVSPQFIIKERVGIGMSMYAPIVNYSKMKSNDASANQYVVSKWKGSGYGFSFNINVLILKGK